MSGKKRTQLTSQLVESLLGGKSKKEANGTGASKELSKEKKSGSVLGLAEEAVEPPQASPVSDESKTMTVEELRSNLGHPVDSIDNENSTGFDSQETVPAGGGSEQQVAVAVGVGHQLGHGVGSSATDAALAQSESMRIAQARINELEKEAERLRRENEGLAAAGATLKRRLDEQSSRAEGNERKLNETQEVFAAEREIFRKSLANKEKGLENLRGQVESLEIRLSTDLKKIRVRERELENRLELVKMEGTALVRSKDELILDLKRQIDQLTGETDNYRVKCQELFRQIESSREQFSRTVRALRIALAGLEGFEGEFGVSLKKVD